MTIHGLWFADENMDKFELDVEVPLADSWPMVVAVNPEDRTIIAAAAQGRNILSATWRCAGQVNSLFFVLPCLKEAEVHRPKMIEWESGSDGSVSLYPWWINLPAAGMDLICQIHPQGCSSQHYHRPEKGIGVSEIYFPILHDGHTNIHLEDGVLMPLDQRVNIAPEQAHQLIRRVSGFSIHILAMFSREHRFPDRGGHVRCNRLTSCGVP